MNKINALVLGVGGNVSQGIIKAILKSPLDINIIGACIDPSSLGLYMCDKAYISPKVSEKSFIPWLINICNSENVQIILTGVEEIVLSIALNYDEILEKTSAISIFTEIEQLRIGQSKLETAKWLKNNGCNYPEFAHMSDSEQVIRLIESVGFPLIAKPVSGKGSNGIVLVTDNNDLLKIKNNHDYILQEYIGDEDSEYTVGCYCNKAGRLMDIIIMHRILKYGTTFKATIVENDEIRSEVERIVNKFKPNGPLNIQLRLNSTGKPICFELNVRFSGTTPIRAHFGFNDVEATIREHILNQNIDNIFNIRNGTAYRYFEEMYIDSEMHDLLTSDKKIEDVSKFSNSADGFGGLRK